MESMAVHLGDTSGSYIQLIYIKVISSEVKIIITSKCVFYIFQDKMSGKCLNLLINKQQHSHSCTYVVQVTRSRQPAY